MSATEPAKVAFPQFNSEQLNAIAQIAELRSFQDGDLMISPGQKDYPFFVIKSGEIRIVERDETGDREVAVHRAGDFTGDVDMLMGRSSMFVAIALGNVEAYQLCAGRLRKVLNECPEVSEMLLEAFQMRRQMLADLPFVGVRVIGNTNTAATSRLREFFYKNHVPHSFFEAESSEGQEQLGRLDASSLERPVVQCNGHTVGNPSLPKLAECIGINRNVDQELFDFVVVGSGPAGLAAAVYAASEGVKTLVIDSVGPGGQAGSSSKIENFIGFPSGLSGSELAGRGYLQALKFGAQFIAPITVHSIDQAANGEHHLQLCTGQTARARCVLVASGVTYRQLDLPGCERFEGAGVYYAATSVEARVCEGKTAVVVVPNLLATMAEAPRRVRRLHKVLQDRLFKIPEFNRLDSVALILNSNAQKRLAKPPGDRYTNASQLRKSVTVPFDEVRFGVVAARRLSFESHGSRVDVAIHYTAGESSHCKVNSR